jgi:hypothetical protein
VLPTAVGHRDPLEQDVLIQRCDIERAFAGQRVGDALDLRSFALVLAAVGEGGHQAEGEDGFLLLLVHALSLRSGCDCERRVASIDKFRAGSKARVAGFGRGH